MKTSILFTLLMLLSVCLVSCAADPEDEDIGQNSSGEHGFNGLPAGVEYNNDDLEWRDGNLTWFESYPDPGSQECIEFNGCDWAGYFAFSGEKKTEDWVKNTHIGAVHSEDWQDYRGKILRVRQDNNQIDLMIYDLCSDNDCNGCCTNNSSATGFLLDMEINTFEKFGGRHGIVQWACLDC